MNVVTDSSQSASRHEISPQFPGFGSGSDGLAGQHSSARGPGPSLNLSVRCVGQLGHHRCKSGRFVMRQRLFVYSSEGIGSADSSDSSDSWVSPTIFKFSNRNFWELSSYSNRDRWIFFWFFWKIFLITILAQSSLKPPKSRLGLSKKKMEISRNSTGLWQDVLFRTKLIYETASNKETWILYLNWFFCVFSYIFSCYNFNILTTDLLTINVNVLTITDPPQCCYRVQRHQA